MFKLNHKYQFIKSKNIPNNIVALFISPDNYFFLGKKVRGLPYKDNQFTLIKTNCPSIDKSHKYFYVDGENKGLTIE